MMKILYISYYKFRLYFINFELIVRKHVMNEDKAIVKRVDKLIRQNNLKYLEAKAHQEYEKNIEHYDKSRKKDMLKSYCDVIKEGNKKAIEKAKQQKRLQQKAKKQKKKASKNIEICEKQKPQDHSQNFHQHITAEQKQQIDRGIQFRAELRLKQLQMQRVNKQLQEQKKKTKLHQLNQKCKKLVARSSKKIDLSLVPQERRKILQAFEQKAMLQVEQLDNIIENIIDKANQKTQNSVPQKRVYENKDKHQLKIQTRSPFRVEPTLEEQLPMPRKRDFHSEKQMIGQKQSDIENCSNEEDFLSLNHPIFSKSEDQLLSLDFIPI